MLAQDPRLEVLVVDDNSPDGTGGIVDALAAENPRVHVCTGRGRWDLARRMWPGFAGRWSRITPTCSRWTPTSRTIRRTCRDFLKAIQTADLVIGSRYRRAG